ncbi:MAG: MarR family transcriptional regulator [Opitutaceae bacterium]|nr:MarR family transcriptional regulator [Opitutaceae bacterium]
MRYKERHLIATPAKASDDLWVLIGRVYLNYIVFLQEQLEADGLAEHIRPGMGHLLFALFTEDNLTLRDLTARTGLAPSSVTETVQGLEREGLISRVRDAVDKRAVRISLTRKARSLEPRCQAVAAQMREVLEHGFTPVAARRLRGDLSRVIHNLHEHLKPADPEP